MRIRNVSSRRVSVGNPSLTIGPGEVVEVNTLAGLSSTELQSLIAARVLVVVSRFTAGNTQLDNFVGEETDEGTLSAGQVTDLTDGGDSALHFHATDRARANHTGTQTKSTISDFAHGAADHTGAIGTLSQISDVTIAVADINILDDGANTTLHFHDSDRARANHTGTQTLSTISDVTISAAQINSFTPSAGTTAGRPVAPTIGFSYFDTTIGKPVWFDGTNYVDATGAIA